MEDVDTLVEYSRYLLWLKAKAEGKQLGSAAEDSCTAEGGVWRTIRGTHVCIREGESVEEAFKRTTGRELEPQNLNGGKTQGKGEGKTIQPTKIGKHTILPSKEDITNRLNNEYRQKIRASIETSLRELSISNQQSKAEVLRDDRISRSKLRSIASPLSDDIARESRDEIFTLTPSEKITLFTWKKQFRKNFEDEVEALITDELTQAKRRYAG